MLSRIIEYENLSEPFLSVQKGFCDGLSASYKMFS